MAPKYVECLGGYTGDGTLKDSIAKASAHLKTSQRDITNVLRMSKGIKNLADGSWMPEELKSGNDAAVLPEEIESYGSPWLLGHQKYSSRRGQQSQVFDGIGRFLFPIEGEFIVIAWSVAELEKIGIKVETGTEFLTKFSKDDSLGWCSKHLKIGMLKDKSQLWIPYGYSWTLIAIGTEQAYAVDQPVMSTALAKDLPENVLLNICQSNVEFFEGDLCLKAVFNKFAPAFKAWAHNICPKLNEKKEKKDKKEKKEKKDKKDKKDKKSNGSKSTKGD